MADDAHGLASRRAVTGGRNLKGHQGTLSGIRAGVDAVTFSGPQL